MRAGSGVTVVKVSCSERLVADETNCEHNISTVELSALNDNKHTYEEGGGFGTSGGRRSRLKRSTSVGLRTAKGTVSGVSHIRNRNPTWKERRTRLLHPRRDDSGRLP